MSVNFLSAQKWSYGIGFGPSFSTISTIGFVSATAPKGLGLLIYGHINYELNDKFSINGKLGLDNRKINYLIGGEELVAINYLSFNPMLKMDLGGEANQGTFLKGGFRLSQLLSAKERDTDLDLQDQYKGTNVGAVLSFGGDFLKHYGMELMLDFALSDELENSNSDLRINTVALLFYVNLNSILKK